MRLGKITSIFMLIHLISGEAAGQEILPKGVGLVGFGYRSYSPVTHESNAQGDSVPVRERLRINFDGDSLLEGAAGSRLQTLADELKRFEEPNENENLYEKLNLGTLQASVDAEVEAQILMSGYGLSDRYTFYFGVPFISAKIDVDFDIIGQNNALEVKSELGELAFESLKDGLDEASKLNKQQIQEVLTEQGYQEIGEWQYQGVGDIVLGIRTEIPGLLDKYSGFSKLVGSIDVSVPTGYVEDPNILHDVDLGNGHYSLGLTAEQQYKTRYFWPYVKAGYEYNFQTKKTVRLPSENEFLVDADRIVKVDFYPGDNYFIGTGFRIPYSYFSLGYDIEQKVYFRDVYDGDKIGNYGKLSEGTSEKTLRHVIGLGFNTALAFLDNKFPVPLMGALKYVSPISQVNKVDLSYYELTLFTFFDAR